MNPLSFQAVRAAALGLVLLAAPGAAAATPERPATPIEFPPPPPPEERTARSHAERRAGAVILEEVTEVSCKALSADSLAAMVGKTSWSRWNRRVRYLVLDGRGAQALTRHAFFGTSAKGLADVRGRTVTADGEVVPLDPQRDVRSLEVKDARGRVKATVQSAFFPRVEPGAVLDLAWTENAEGVSLFEVVRLQSEFPVRSLRVTSHGLLLKPYFRVPFFLGPVPPRARARVDGAFNLDLEILDLEPAAEEPYAPPAARTAYTLALDAQAVDLSKRRETPDWRRNLVLFGPPDSAPVAGGLIAEGDIDDLQAIVRLDDRGLQPPPDSRTDSELLESKQWYLQTVHADIAKFLRRSIASDAKDVGTVAAIAPPELPWRQRAERLYEHALKRIQPDSRWPRLDRLERLLAGRYGHPSDLALYYYLLLVRARIPAHLVLALNRNRLPLHPLTPLGALDPLVLVEIAPAGEAPLYLIVSHTRFGTLPDDYRGALAFRRPDAPKAAWPLFQIPLEQPGLGRTQVSFASPLAAEGEEVELSVASSLEGAAALEFLERMGFPRASSEQRRVVMAGWVDQWTNLPFTGEAPETDSQTPTREPFSFTLKLPWRPEVQRIGEQLLVPALPPADLFRNPFRQESRQQPIWLPGGRFEVSLAWELAPGATPGPLPAAAGGEGPGGLAYALEVAAEPPAAEGGASRVTTRLWLDIPPILPAAEYAGVRRFFEELQRAAETRLLITAGT